MTSRTRLAGFLLIASSLGLWLPPARALDNTSSAEPAPPAKFVAPGLGDPGQLVEVSIESGRAVDGVFTLDGQDARQQLVVTGKYSTGQLRDLTSSISYTSEPAGVVNVESTGHVIPLADGTATITAKSDAGPVGTIRASVIHYGNDPAGELPEPNRADLHQARLQQRRLPRQGQRPERLQAVAAWVLSRPKTSSTW